MAPIKISVEGVGGVILSTDAGLDKWLENKKVQCLIDSHGDEVVGFDSLVDGGTYTPRPLTTPWERINEDYRAYLEASGYSAHEFNDPSFKRSETYNSFNVFKQQQQQQQPLVDGSTYTLGPPKQQQSVVQPLPVPKVVTDEAANRAMLTPDNAHIPETYRQVASQCGIVVMAISMRSFGRRSD